VSRSGPNRSVERSQRSVLAPILAVMLALTSGFHIVFFTGAAMYFIAFGVIRPALKTTV